MMSLAPAVQLGSAADAWATWVRNDVFEQPAVRVDYGSDELHDGRPCDKCEQ